MNRTNDLPDFDSKDCEVLYVDPVLKDHLKVVLRPDGTTAIGALSYKGMETLTNWFSADPEFDDWDEYSLPGGDVYLMEDNND